MRRRCPRSWARTRQIFETWFREEALALERALKPWLHARQRAGLALFVDQAEELFTQVEPAEAERFSELLLSLIQSGTATRLIICVRSDFVSRLVTLRGFAGVVSHALHLIGPLTRERLRSTIVGPARQAGVRFASEQLVEDLVNDAESSAGGLPLLQFALTELWEARDREQGLITTEAVQAVGGVGGALARHADRVVRQLLPEERSEARRLLMGLVTAEGTRATRNMDELTASRGPARNALEALIRGRLLVARDVHGLTQYELAHDSLVTRWPALVEWLAIDAERERARMRLGAGAREWERLERARDGLLRGRALREAIALGPNYADPLVGEFVDISRRHRRRSRAGIAAGLLLIPISLGGVAAGASLRSRAQLEASTADLLRRAEGALQDARAVSGEALARRDRALSQFDSPTSPREAAEETWAEALGLRRDADRKFVSAAQLLESALLGQPKRAEIRASLVSALSDRARLAERFSAQERADELLAQAQLLDPRATTLLGRDAPAQLRITVKPPEAVVSVERYVDDEGFRRPERLQHSLKGSGELRLSAGSYRLIISLPGYATLLDPVLLEAGEVLERRLSLRQLSDVPANFVVIPAGRFLTGAGDDETLRAAQAAAPLHSVQLDEFLIARDETTFSDWISYLEALPVRERQNRLPIIRSTKGGLRLERLKNGRWQLSMRPPPSTTSSNRRALRLPRTTEERRTGVGTLSRIGNRSCRRSGLCRSGWLRRAEFPERGSAPSSSGRKQREGLMEGPSPLVSAVRRLL